MNKKKGFYIKKQRDGSVILNLFKPDFVPYLETIEDDNGWIKFRIYEREKATEKGLTHNMESLQKLNKEN